MGGHRSGTFNVEVAAQLGVPPGRARGLLKDGTPVEIREGVVIYPDQVPYSVLYPKQSAAKGL